MAGCSIKVSSLKPVGVILETPFLHFGDFVHATQKLTRKLPGS
jgi:hypothetical protein